MRPFSYPENVTILSDNLHRNSMLIKATTWHSVPVFCKIDICAFNRIQHVEKVHLWCPFSSVLLRLPPSPTERLGWKRYEEILLLPNLPHMSPDSPCILRALSFQTTQKVFSIDICFPAYLQEPYSVDNHPTFLARIATHNLHPPFTALCNTIHVTILKQNSYIMVLFAQNVILSARNATLGFFQVRGIHIK